MGGSSLPPLRGLPRAFVPGLPDPLEEYFDLPKEEYDKFHKVLRMASGDRVAVLTGDGRLVTCELVGRGCQPLETLRPQTESQRSVVLALGLPKPDNLEESVRMATEMGVSKFVVFPADRSVVKWDSGKAEQKTERLKRIAREAAEVSFRARLPAIVWRQSLAALLEEHPTAIVLSEVEGIGQTLSNAIGSMDPSAEIVLMIGPEGGWAPREVALIGARAVTLGPRVLRVDTAAAAACALALLQGGA